MAGNPYLWSTTAATNSAADSDINFAEGQSPGSVNDSVRALMAGTAGWLKDTNSTLTTGGTANVLTVTTNIAYTALATGIRLHLKASLTNTTACTLNVTPAGGAAFGPKSIRVFTADGETDPVSGAITANGHYIIEYDTAANSAAGGWLLLNPTLSAFTTGDVKTTFKVTADAGWVMMNDGSIGNVTSSATTRANADTLPLFTLLYNNIATLIVQDSAGTPVGRGANAAADYAANRRLVIPAVLGRALAGAGVGSGLTSRVLGTTVGEETHILTTTELAAHAHGVTDPTHNHPDPGHLHGGVIVPGSQNTSGGLQGIDIGNTAAAVTGIQAAATGISIQSTGSGSGHNTMQPTSFLNVMIKL